MRLASAPDPDDGIAVEFRRFTEPADMAHATPGVVMQVTPHEHHGFFVELTTLRLGEVSLVHGTCSPLALLAKPERATVVLQLPLDGFETLMLNGRPVPPYGFCLYGPGAELVRSNVQANSYAVLAMPPWVAEQHLREEGDLLAIGPGQSEMRTAQPADWERMARLIRSAAGIAREAPEMLASEPPRLALRSALLGVARDLVHGSWTPNEPRRRPASEAWRAIVLGAEAYLHTHLDRPIYTEELCEALGVSPTRLMEAFHGMLGTTPHRYLKLRRLNLVRAALSRGAAQPPLVKCVALSHGFWHLGQFSQDYRAHFGETPTQTLARAHPGFATRASSA